MRIVVQVIKDDGTVGGIEIGSNGPIHIDLDPTEPDRVGPGSNNGLMGPGCLVQVLKGVNSNLVVGLHIVPELGRDDSQYEGSLAIPENPKV